MLYRIKQDSGNYNNYLAYIRNERNLRLYHYAGKNPVKYTDPDGRENKAALQFMKDYIVGKNSGYGYSPDPYIPGDTWTAFKKGAENLPDSLLCYESVWASYRNTGTTKDMPASRANAFDWFKAGGKTFVNGIETTKKLEKNILNGESGDVVFMGEFDDMYGHSVLLESIVVISDDKLELNTVGAFSPNGKVGPEKMIFEKNKDGKWINTSHGNYKYEFRGYGQYEK